MLERTNRARGANEWEDTYGSLGVTPQAQLAQIPLAVLDPWQDQSGESQPFDPYSQEDLDDLAENIRQNGIIEPIHIRPMPNGRFQIISGHNRCAAAKLAGLSVVPALVQELDDNRAAILMVDSNLKHREKLKPSEIGKAYKVKLTAMNHQGKTSVQLEQKLSRSAVAKEFGVSEAQVHRYIRLTYLIKPLLNNVDAGKFSVNAAVAISFLPEPEQALLLEAIQENHLKCPSLKQAKVLQEMSSAGQLTKVAILGIYFPTAKSSAATPIPLPTNRIAAFFPPNTSLEVMEEEICKALSAYRKETEIC